MTSDTYLLEERTTKSVPPVERAEFWTEVVTRFHCAARLEYPHRHDIRAHAIRLSTRTYQLIRWCADEGITRRTANHIKNDPDEDYRVIIPISGVVALQHAGQAVELRPGSAGLISGNEQFDVWRGMASEAFVMTVSRREIDMRRNSSAPIASVIDLQKGLGRVVSDLVIGLFEERDTLTGSQFDAVSARLVELMCMLMVGDDRPQVAGHLQDVESMVRRYVRTHADDPQMTPLSVAHALGWSLRQVQLALQQAGTTPRQLIKEERLTLAHEWLQSPAHRHRTVTNVARKLGFSSVNAFSNAFRQHFGAPPRDIR